MKEIFIRSHLVDARFVSKKWRIPTSVLIAQSALETQWGQHVLDNAYFGIKGKSPDGNSLSFGTHEYINGKKVSINDTFRAYKNFFDSADDYGRFLAINSRYKICFDFTKHPEKFADCLALSGYATDPTYSLKLKRIIKENNLSQYDI